MRRRTIAVLAAGGILLLVGVVVSLSEERLAVLAATLVIVGIQIFFASFLLSILGLRRSK